VAGAAVAGAAVAGAAVAGAAVVAAAPQAVRTSVAIIMRLAKMKIERFIFFCSPSLKMNEIYGT
jgi:acetamidase/formamidase